MGRPILAADRLSSRSSRLKGGCGQDCPPYRRLSIFFMCLMDALPAALFLQARQRVLLALQMLGLPPHFGEVAEARRIERFVGQRLGDGAAGLALMPAIAKAAPGGQFLDLVEVRVRRLPRPPRAATRAGRADP